METSRHPPNPEGSTVTLDELVEKYVGKHLRFDEIDIELKWKEAAFRVGARGKPAIMIVTAFLIGFGLRPPVDENSEPRIEGPSDPPVCLQDD